MSNKIIVSALLAFGAVGVAVVSGIRSADETPDVATELAPEFAALRQYVSALREEIRGLTGSVDNLRTSQGGLASKVSA